MCFNSRTPCGVRLGAMLEKDKIQAFQFTHPVRGATQNDNHHNEVHIRFNSRTPCGVRLQAHAYQYNQDEFQFTHPVRGATAMLKGTHK